MSDLKVGRTVIAMLVTGAVLVGVAGGLYAGRRIVHSRPSCTNAVDNYFNVMPDEQRRLFDDFSQFGRDAHVRLCRQGRWSEAMRSCWLGATSLADIDACPNEWLNATSICEQMSREAERLAHRCHKDSGTVDCKAVRGIGLGIKECIEALRDANCSEIEKAKESCTNVLVGPR